MNPFIPADNPHLVGHQIAQATLYEAFHSTRFHHAWLMTGPKGIGKSTLAYRFARHVLSQGGDAANGGGLFGDSPDSSPDMAMDPENPLFRRIAEGAHPDMMIITRSLNDRGVLRAEISVDDVRPLNDFLAKTPAEGGWRVVIVDAVDEMNANAANALLKQLEEPPRRSLLLLVCHRQGRLLPTIISRCRRLPMRSLEIEDIGRVLSLCRPELASDEIPLLSRLAEGSAGRAAELADMGGAKFHDQIRDLLAGLPKINTSSLHSLADASSGAGENAGFPIVTTFLQWWIDRLIVHAAGGAGTAQGEDAALLDRLVEVFPVNHWLEARDRVNALVSAAAGGGNLDRRQVVLSMFMALT